MFKVERSMVLSGSELACLLGVSRTTAYYWASGRVQPSNLALQRLAVLGVVIVLPPRRAKPKT